GAAVAPVSGRGRPRRLLQTSGLGGCGLCSLERGAGPVTATSVVYVLPDKVGGVFTVVKNLLQHRPADGWAHYAVLTDNRLDGDARAVERLAADGERRVEYR